MPGTITTGSFAKDLWPGVKTLSPSSKRFGEQTPLIAGNSQCVMAETISREDSNYE